MKGVHARVSQVARRWRGFSTNPTTLASSSSWTIPHADGLSEWKTARVAMASPSRWNSTSDFKSKSVRLSA